MMTHRFLLCLALLCLALVLPARAQDSDLEQIREVIGYYFEGHATGVASHFEKAFHSEAKLFWIRDGQLSQRTSAEYISRARGVPPEDESERKRRIVSIDVSGTAAVVKVELDYPSALIYDYMSMLKVDGSWKIINKTFVVNARGE